VASGYLRAARQLEVLLGWNPVPRLNTDKAAKTVALLQHHDALTGTDRFQVNQDYRKLLAKGDGDCRFCTGLISSTCIVVVLFQQFTSDMLYWCAGIDDTWGILNKGLSRLLDLSSDM